MAGFGVSNMDVHARCEMWQLNGWDVAAQWLGCGGSMAGMRWLNGGMWWLNCGMWWLNGSVSCW
jgi:hypothetical protein